MANNNQPSFNIRKTDVTLLLFFFASLFMHNFYKITLGSIANDFSDPTLTIPMIVSYVLFVICFICYFINYYLKKFNKVASLIYSTIVVGVAVFALVGIFQRLDVYISNNNLGVYSSLPSIFIQFPYDAILINVVLILVQVYNVSTIVKPNHKYAYLKEKGYALNLFKVRIYDFLFVLVVTICSLFTLGDFVCGLNAIENALHDPKYVFLMAWVLMPVINLFIIMFRFENNLKTKVHKFIYFGSIILVNLLFIGLFFIFEACDPNFVAVIGKPLFPITFSISLPVEIYILIGVQAVGMVVALKKIAYLLLKKEKSE